MWKIWTPIHRYKLILCSLSDHRGRVKKEISTSFFWKDRFKLQSQGKIFAYPSRKKKKLVEKSLAELTFDTVKFLSNVKTKVFIYVETIPGT